MTPKSWPDTKRLGKGKRSQAREGLRPCPANFQSVKLAIEYLLKIRAIGKFLLTSLYGRDDKTI